MPPLLLKSDSFGPDEKAAILELFDPKRLAALEKRLELDSPSPGFREGLAQIVYFAVQEARVGPASKKIVREKLGRVEGMAASLASELAVFPSAEPAADRTRLWLAAKGQPPEKLDSIVESVSDLSDAAQRAQSALNKKGGRAPEVWRYALIEKLDAYAERLSGRRLTYTNDAYDDTPAPYKGALVELADLAAGAVMRALGKTPLSNRSIGKLIERVRGRT